MLVIAALSPATFTASAAPFSGLARCHHPLCCAAKAEASIQCDDDAWAEYATKHNIVAPKLRISKLGDSDRGKGGVFALEPIAPMEVIATIPRDLILSPSSEAIEVAERGFSACSENPASEATCWAHHLTAAALLALHSPEGTGAGAAKQSWLQRWAEPDCAFGGGWATNNADLGQPGVRWGADDVTGNLLATGSDNDKNIYAKFRFPCHPVVHRAGLGLAALTKADRKKALDAVVRRGFLFRSMSDALDPLVDNPSPRLKGSKRERRAWDVADTLSRVMSRATSIQLGEEAEAPTVAIVPLHERLAHCGDERGENVKVVGRDPRDDGDEQVVLLVATRAIESGEALTRDYHNAPRIPGDDTEGALRLLLQFGLPPAAW